MLKISDQLQRLLVSDDRSSDLVKRSLEGFTTAQPSSCRPLRCTSIDIAESASFTANWKLLLSSTVVNRKGPIKVPIVDPGGAIM